MSNYNVPRWRYDYDKTGRGLNLKLLSVKELSVSSELLLGWIRPTSALEFPEWYKPIVKSDSYENLWLYCCRLIKGIVKDCPDSVNEHEMNALNEELNRIFSDEGWRNMKQKFSQQSKRLRKVRPELSTSIATSLHQFKAEQGLVSLDEAVDYLLSFYNEHNEDAGGANVE